MAKHIEIEARGTKVTLEEAMAQSTQPQWMQSGGPENPSDYHSVLITEISSSSQKGAR